MQPQLLRRIRSNLEFLDEEVRNADAIQRLRVEGGWYAVLRVPVKQSDEDLAIELIGRGVILHPGHFYDFSRDGFLVVSLITPSQEFSEGIRVVLEMFDRSSSTNTK